MKIDKPSPELIAAAEAAGVYAFGHPPDPTPAEALKAEDDAPEHYEVSRLPLLLREHVDMVLACETEPHVIEDARAIVAQAADYIAAAPPPPDAGEVRTYRDDAFIWRWVERGLYDKDISAKEALSLLAHSPMAPWNNGRWDVDHKPYAAKLYADHPKAAAIRKLP